MQAAMEREMKLAAVSAMVVIGACGPALAAPGGTIHFFGAIVVPMFVVSTATTAQSAGPAGAFNTSQAGENGASAAITYTAASRSHPRADVSVIEVHDDAFADRLAAPVAVRTSFTDGTGHRREVNDDGAYLVGESGGVLRLHESGGADRPAPAGMMVVTTYH